MSSISVKNSKGISLAYINNKEVLPNLIDLTLFGRGVENYLDDLNTNFVRLLETNANNEEPDFPIDGELWYNTDKKSLSFYNGGKWVMNVDKIGGKTLTEIRASVLTKINVDDKLNKSGGAISGSLQVNNNIKTSGNIVPTSNEKQDIGSDSRRFKTLYIKDGSIFLGEKGKYHITKDSFVYTVNSNADDVTSIPTGVLVLNKSNGIMLVKKLSGKFDGANNTFGKLMYDSVNAVRIGEDIFTFLGEISIASSGYRGCWGNIASNFIKNNISTPGNSVSFGNTTHNTFSKIGVSGGARGLINSGGWPGWNWNSILEYITFSTPANAIGFGNATYRSVEASGHSDGTRGIFAGGWGGYVALSSIDYVTIQTPSSTNNFGNMQNRRMYSRGECSNGTRAIMNGGYGGAYSWNSQIEYVTIATPSNGIGFGRFRFGRTWCHNTVSDGVSGYILGGWSDGGYGCVDKVVISTPANSVFFGNLGHYGAHAAASSNGNKILSMAGWGSGCWYSDIRTLSTTTTGNAAYFGQLDTPRMHFDATAGN